MKYSIFLFLIIPYFVNAQYESYGYQSPGMDLVLESSMIKYRKKNKGHPNRSYVNSLRSSYESKLLNEANRRLKSAIDNQKVLDRYKQRHFNREVVLASAWAHSETGLLSGLTWFDLTDANKEMYRSRFKSYWSQPTKPSPAPAFSQSSSLEKEISIARLKSKTGQNDGRLWSQIPEPEKRYYRNNYIARKNNELPPNNNTMLAQIEYKEAWLMLKNHGSTDKYWHELSSFEKSRFRKEYSMMKRHQSDGLLALK